MAKRERSKDFQPYIPESSVIMITIINTNEIYKLNDSKTIDIRTKKVKDHGKGHQNAKQHPKGKFLIKQPYEKVKQL